MRLWVCVMAASALAATTAKAAIYRLTWIGSFEAGHDDRGTYYPERGPLTGKPVRIEVAVDTRRGVAEVDPAGGGSYVGSSNGPYGSPISHLRLWLNDQPLEISDHLNDARVWMSQHGYALSVNQSYWADSLNRYNRELSVAVEFDDPRPFTGNDEFDISGGNGSADIMIGRYYRPWEGNIEHLQGRLVLSSLKIQTGVPEPSSWALLVGGFMTMGGVLRRRPLPSPRRA